MTKEQPSVHSKAFALNLDRTIFGTLAEIGAGQEVSRWLFRVGGAAGTIAKTMSAYDMSVSDQIYGKVGRYVSRERLGAMLDHEYGLLVERLGRTRGADSRFFVFADTVSARNYKGTNECHGWLGLRFQAEPGAPPNDVHLHVNLLDGTNLLQQEAVGLLGINLIHAAYYRRESPDTFLASLVDELSLDRVEVDSLHLAGPAFQGSDPIATGLRLVRQGLARAVLFGNDGGLAPPTEVFHKRAVVLHRSRWMLPAGTSARLLENGILQLQGESTGGAIEPIAVLEIGAGRLLDGTEATDEELLAKLREAASFGPFLLLTSYAGTYHLTGYFRRYTHEELRIVIGVASLIPLLQQRSYTTLAGGVLEGIGKLLADRVRAYVAPMPPEALREYLARFDVRPEEYAHPSAGPVTATNLEIRTPAGHLLRYLLEVGWLVPLHPDPDRP